MSLFEGKLFLSTDGAATFTERAFTLPRRVAAARRPRRNRGGQDRLYTTPARKATVIAASNGLYHSTDSGETFARMDGVSEVHAFGFGRRPPGAKSAALYLVGGSRPARRSASTTRQKLGTNQRRSHQWGWCSRSRATPKQYGRVYVGSHGAALYTGTRHRGVVRRPMKEDDAVRVSRIRNRNG